MALPSRVMVTFTLNSIGQPNGFLIVGTVRMTTHPLTGQRGWREKIVIDMWLGVNIFPIAVVVMLRAARPQQQATRRFSGLRWIPDLFRPPLGMSQITRYPNGGVASRLVQFLG